jgi:hypothetical protein
MKAAAISLCSFVAAFSETTQAYLAKSQSQRRYDGWTCFMAGKLCNYLNYQRDPRSWGMLKRKEVALDNNVDISAQKLYSSSSTE